MERSSRGIPADVTGIVGHTVGLVGRIGTVVESLTITLAAAQQRNDEQFRRTDARIGELGERLDTMVQMFERHLPEDHGYRPS